MGLSTVSTSAGNDDPALRTQLYFGDGDYLKALGLTLIQGEYFSPSQVRTEEPVIVISESLARKISAQNLVLGKSLYMRGSTRPSRIIGVVKDFNLPNEPEQAAIYAAYIPSAFPFFVVKMPERFRLARDQVNLALSKINPQLKVYRFHSTAEIFAEHTKDAKVAAIVTAGLALLSLALAGLGIFAVVRTQLQLRHYELAVRQSLGARPYQLVILTLLDSLKPLLWSVLALVTCFALLQLSAASGSLDQLAQQLSIDPWHAFTSTLVVITVTACIVLSCIRPLLKQPPIVGLKG
jgi:hypothetical protein